MPTADYSSYHQASGTVADGTKFDNFVDAVQASVNALDNNNFAAGKIFDLTKLMQNSAVTGSLLRWDGTNWSKTTNVIVDDTNSKITLGGDTNLYRGGAGRLFTDGSIEAINSYVMGKILMAGTMSTTGMQNNSIAMQNAAADPSAPSGGGNLYVINGALKYRGSSGTITTIAVA